MDKTTLRILKRVRNATAPGLLGGLGLLAMLAFGQAATAQPSQLLITEVFVDTPGVDQLTINGVDFDSGGSPNVTLGEDSGTHAVVPNPTATEIIVDLPEDLPAGDYRLTVTTGGGTGRTDSYDLTIPATDPTGEVPTDGIILWDQSDNCPTGFARVTTFDGRFLMASNSAGNTGGSNDHSHGAGTLTGVAHRHNLEPWDRVFAPVDDNSGGTDFNARTDMAGGGGMTGTSDLADSRPEFATILLCRRS
jgi:hypothetical protein